MTRPSAVALALALVVATTRLALRWWADVLAADDGELQ